MEVIPLLTLDLHPIFPNNRDIDLALREVIFKAAQTGVDVVEIIPGKGSGKLKKRVLTFLGQKHIKKLYVRVEPMRPTAAGSWFISGSRRFAELWPPACRSTCRVHPTPGADSPVTEYRSHVMAENSKCPDPLPYGPGNGPGNRHSRPGQDTGTCPVPGCEAVIGATRLMCRWDWYQVPKPLRDEVWAAWRSGAGASAPGHRRAVRRALAAASAGYRGRPVVCQGHQHADPAA